MVRRPVGANRHHAFIAHIVGACIAVGVEILAIFAVAFFGVAARIVGAGFGVHVAVASLILARIAFFLIVLFVFALVFRF